MTRIFLLLVGAGATLAAALIYSDPVRIAHARALVASVVGPSQPETPPRIVDVKRNRSGDFAVNVRINGARTPMVMDTGASAVVLTFDAAKAAGLPTEMLDYSVSIDTANGKTRAASVVLEKIAIGQLSETAVPALIVEPGKLKVSLLGMSFLDRLHSWEVSGERVRLRGYP